MSSPTSTPTSTTPVWRIVAAREVATQVRSKAFLISLGLLVLGLVGTIVAYTLLSGRPETREVAVVDAVGASAVEAGADSAATLDEQLTLEARSYDDAGAAEAAVADGEVDAALLPTADGYELVGDEDVDATTSQAVGAAVVEVTTARNAEAQGVDLTALADGTRVEQRLLDPDSEDAGLRSVAAVVFVALFYITALTFGMSMAASVTQEKESRVVEILAAAVHVRALLWGKVAGTSVLAIGQTMVLAAVGVVALLASGNLDALGVLGPAIGWYVAFFVLGFVALAGLWAVAGSLASRQQDLQGTTAPLQVLLFAPYIVAVTAGEQVMTVVSMVPIVSTMLMPARLATGDVPLWQLGLAVVLTVAAAYLLVRGAARAYERTLLQTGRRISFSEAFRLSR